MISLDPAYTTPLAEYIDIVDTALATVSRRLPSHVARDDLASVGKIALIAALDQRKGSADETRAYCFVRVRGAMLDELRRLDPLSRRHRDLVNAVGSTQLQLTQRLGRSPTKAELAEAAGISLVEVNRGLRALEAETEFADPEWQALPDDVTPSPAERMEAEDLRDNLKRAFLRLSSVQALVLQRYYFDEKTLEQIADEIGVSKERVRQIRNAAEGRLRADYAILAVWQSILARV